MLKQTIALVGLLISITSHAAVVATYDNLNREPGEQLYGNGGTWVGKGGFLTDSITEVGSTFTASTSGTFYSFELGYYISSPSTQTTNQVTWSLHIADGVSADLSNQVWSQSYTDQINYGFRNTSTFNVSNGIELIAGTEYWLIANVATNGTVDHSWKTNNTGATSDLRRTYEFDRSNLHRIDTDYYQDTGTYAMAVNVQAVPVPAAAWLFGSAFVGLVGFKRKK